MAQIEYTEVLPTDRGWYDIAKRLGGSQTQAHKDANAGYLASANGRKNITDPIFVNQVVWYNPAKLIKPPSLATLADRIIADLDTLLATWAAEVTPAREQIAEQAVVRMIADVDRVCAALSVHNIDPATINPEAGLDASRTLTAHTGKLQPGRLYRDVRFTGEIEREVGTDLIVVLNFEHVGNGEMLKLWGPGAPLILINGRIKPSTPTASTNGVRGHHISMFGVDISGVVDGIWPMNSQTGPQRADLFAYFTKVHDLKWFASASGQTDGTHNDDVQWPYSQGVYWYRCEHDAGTIGNANLQLGSGKSNTDPPGDWFDMSCRWAGGDASWRLSAGRPITGAIASLGSTWSGGTDTGYDVIAAAEHLDNLHLIGARHDDGSPIIVQRWQ